MLACPAALAAQGEPARAIRVSDVVLAGLGGAAYLTPHIFDLKDRLPACAPCDRSGVAWFDRWAIAVPRSTPDVASTILELGLAGVTWWDLSQRGGRGLPHITASIQAGAWAVGATELAKVVVARKRPVLYTTGAPGAAGDLDNQRSFPSAHTAGAFALATSYWLSTRGTGASWQRWAVFAAAATVGGLRVAAHRHFPSDVLSGAAVGVLSAVVVHEIRF